MMTSNTSAAELVHRMRKAYATVSMYTDRGTASSSAGRLRVTFQTMFVRGHRFRFEYGRENNREAIWSDGAHTYTHWPSGPRVGRPEVIDDGADIATAMGAAVGTSSGTSDIVPAMLLPMSVGAFCSRLGDLDELSIDGDEHIGQSACVRINGHSPRQGFATLWLDRDTYLLRRVVVSRGLMHETMTSYEPSLDPIDIRSIESPDVELVAPRARATRWTGVRIATGSRLVKSIEDGSPAARSGLTIGDEVEVVNGQRTEGFTDVVKALGAVNIGEQLTLTIRRGGSTLEVPVLVEAAPRPQRPAPSGPLME